MRELPKISDAEWQVIEGSMEGVTLKCQSSYQ